MIGVAVKEVIIEEGIAIARSRLQHRQSQQGPTRDQENSTPGHGLDAAPVIGNAEDKEQEAEMKAASPMLTLKKMRRIIMRTIERA